MIEKQEIQTGLISKIVFCFTLGVVLINQVSIIFPALIVRISSHYSSTVNPLEPSPTAIPFLASSIFFFGIGFLYYKKNLPDILHRSIDFILNFEVSRKVTFIVITILLIFYIGLSLNELTINESTQWPDFNGLTRPALDLWPFHHSSNHEVTEQEQRHMRMLLLFISENVFHNIKIVPFLASISLVALTYLTTTKISKKRFSGLVSMVILLQSYTFLKYDTVASYDNFWIVFYLLSIYFIFRQWYISPISYVLSIFSKVYAAPFFLMTLFFVYKINVSKNKKILILISYIIAVVVSAVVIEIEGNVYSKFVHIDLQAIYVSLTMWANQMRFDALIELTILPVIVALFFKSKTGNREADAMLVMLAGILLTGPVFSILQPELMEPYRLVSFSVFFALSIGVLLAKKTTSLYT